MTAEDTCRRVESRDLKRAGDVIDQAFATTPFHHYLVRYCKNINLKVQLTEKDFENVFRERIASFHEHGADIVEADDFAAVAAWFKPGLRPPPGGVTEKFFEEYSRKLEVLEKKHGMQDRRDWHLMLIGRDPTNTTKGSIRKLFEPYLQKAREEKAGAALEAISLHAASVYEHFGFRVVDTFTMGEGQVDKDNTPNPEGKGHTLYFMVYDA